jgi:hypothetical protein
MVRKLGLISNLLGPWRGPEPRTPSQVSDKDLTGRRRSST